MLIKLIKIFSFIIFLTLLSYLFLFCLIAFKNHSQKLKKADAIVVLGAAAWGEKPSPVLKNRLKQAVNLYQEGYANYLIFTGGTPKKGFTTEGDVSAKWAIKQKVPASKIIVESTSRNTYENLLGVKELTKEKHLKSFILVSDSFHLTRAQIIAELLGLDAQTSATPYSNFSQKPRREQLRIFIKETNSSFASLFYYCYLTYLKSMLNIILKPLKR